jgi:uncharacterized protein
MRFYSTSDISTNISKTPEGFLLCRNVPISRTGEQTYYEGEVPVTAGEGGVIIIERLPEDVFHPEAMASFEGKPVTLRHPEDAVTPDNWRNLSIGHTQNIRKGEGIEGDACYGDILIMDAKAIQLVIDREIREVSCGYDAEYVEVLPGRGRQVNIRGNHVALVEQGRCGSLCAIHDAVKNKDSKKGEPAMKGLFKKMFGSLTADEQKELGVTVHDSALTVDQRLDKMEHNIGLILKAIKDAASEGKETEEEEEKEKKAAADKETEEEEEKEKKAAADKKAKDEAAEEEEKKGKKETEDEEKEKEETKDCSYGKSQDSAPVLQDILYRSSILAPELRPLTADALPSKRSFKDACCLHKRKALDAAFKTEDGRKAVVPFLAGKSDVDFFTADCATVDVAFIGASEVMKATSQTRVTHKGTNDMLRGAVTPADLNKKNAAFWADKKGGI